MTSSFDATAPTFELHRALPEQVPGAIRTAIWSAAGLSGPARVLDIGAGTGRIGRAFVAAGDAYCGIDASLAMLQEFSLTSDNCTLMHADARHLPFTDGCFDAVLLMQVLSGADDWREIVTEARRVVRTGGCIAVGRSVSPESAIDSQLKRHLKRILEELQMGSFRQEQSRREALDWLSAAAADHAHRVAATWNVNVTPGAFLERHRTGARFAALLTDIQDRAINRLRGWAEKQYGSVDAEFRETRTFEVDVFKF